MNNIQFQMCDFANQDHCFALISLLSEYMKDPMGNVPPLNQLQQLRVLNGLETHPASYVLFAKIDEEYVGLAVCFINFSTFQVKPYTNIHDFIVSPKFRKQGVGNAMLLKIQEIAEQKKHCKITLEVRNDNIQAKSIYSKFGFEKTYPEMLFWSKQL